MMTTIALVLGAFTSTLIAGYLFGLWRGQGAREALRIELEGMRKSAFDARSLASTAHAEAEWLRGSAAEAKVEVTRLNIELTQTRTTLQRTRKTCMTLQSEVTRYRKTTSAPVVEKEPAEAAQPQRDQTAQFEEELATLRATNLTLQAAEERARTEGERLRAEVDKLAAEHERSREGASKVGAELARARHDAGKYRLLVSALTDDLRRTKESEARARALVERAHDDVRRSREEADQARADASAARKMATRAERQSPRTRDDASEPRKSPLRDAQELANSARWEETAREISAMRATLSAITLRLALMSERPRERDTERPEGLHDVLNTDDAVGNDDVLGAADGRTGTAG